MKANKFGEELRERVNNNATVIGRKKRQCLERSREDRNDGEEGCSDTIRFMLRE